MPGPRVGQLSREDMQTLRDPGFFHLLLQLCTQQMKEERLEDSAFMGQIERWTYHFHL